MATYEVTIRGGTQLESEPEPLVDAVRSLGPRTFEADSPADAASRAMQELSSQTTVLLVQVRDERGRPTIHWPSGEPVSYVRIPLPDTVEGYCFAQVAGDDCPGRGAPEGETAVFAEQAGAFGWVCDACAAIVAPDL